MRRDFITFYNIFLYYLKNKVCRGFGIDVLEMTVRVMLREKSKPEKGRFYFFILANLIYVSTNSSFEEMEALSCTEGDCFV
jgi:hypothetical protein